MTLARRPSRAMLTATFTTVGMLVATAAHAGDCNTDIAGLSQKRQAIIEKLNVQAKSAKGKLDPAASCPILRNLVQAEGALVKYLDSNKNWCNVPDDAINNLKGATAKSQSFATQACTVAAQAKKAQQQQAASAASGLGEIQKLPAGPL